MAIKPKSLHFRDSELENSTAIYNAGKDMFKKNFSQMSEEHCKVRDSKLKKTISC